MQHSLFVTLLRLLPPELVKGRATGTFPLLLMVTGTHVGRFLKEGTPRNSFLVI